MSNTVPTITSDAIDPHAPGDPEVCEDIARMLGDPLPADWRDPAAVAARQDHLAAVAAITGEAAIEVFRAFFDARARNQPYDPDAPETRRLVDETTELLKALRAYVHHTQRGDGRRIITGHLTTSAGAAIAGFVNEGLDQQMEIENQVVRERMKSGLYR
jgi:hypothetical protein